MNGAQDAPDTPAVKCDDCCPVPGCDVCGPCARHDRPSRHLPHHLGSAAVGAEVDLGKWAFPAHAPAGVVVSVGRHRVIANYATTTGVVIVTSVANGGRFERDGYTPILPHPHAEGRK